MRDKTRRNLGRCLQTPADSHRRDRMYSRSFAFVQKPNYSPASCVKVPDIGCTFGTCFESPFARKLRSVLSIDRCERVVSSTDIEGPSVVEQLDLVASSSFSIHFRCHLCSNWTAAGPLRCDSRLVRLSAFLPCHCLRTTAADICVDTVTSISLLALAAPPRLLSVLLRLSRVWSARHSITEQALQTAQDGVAASDTQRTWHDMRW